jgi:hypothetical protein
VANDEADVRYDLLESCMLLGDRGVTGKLLDSALRLVATIRVETGSNLALDRALVEGSHLVSLDCVVSDE